MTTSEMSGGGREISRRRFLQWVAAGTCGAAVPISALSATKPLAGERKLMLFNMHTEERLSVTYFEQGRLVPEAIASLNRLLRDHRTNEIAPIDNRLFDLLYLLHNQFGSGKQPFHIFSGFRSPSSNAHLVANTTGVASGSLHMKGQAIDICLPGCDLALLRDAAIELKSGGVGFYPASNFVHIDVGRVRSW